VFAASTPPPGGFCNLSDLKIKGLIAPSGVRGALKRGRLYADGCRPLTGGPRKPAVAIIQIFTWIIEGEVCGEHEDIHVAR
jgi:hypothetical protein